MTEFEDSLGSAACYRSTKFHGGDGNNRRRQSTIDIDKRYLPVPTTTQRFHSWHPNPVRRSLSTAARPCQRDTTIWFDNFGMMDDRQSFEGEEGEEEEESCMTSIFSIKHTLHTPSTSSNSSQNENISRNQVPFYKRTNAFSPVSSLPSSPLSYPFRHHHQKRLSTPKYSVTTPRLPTFACFFPRRSSP